MNRRSFVTDGSLALGSLPFLIPPDGWNKRKFKICLNAGAVGIQADMAAVLELARRFGFEAITASIGELSAMSGPQLDQFSDRMKEYGISWGAGGLPVQFRNDLTTFKNDLFGLSKHAETASHLGLEGLSTWIMPTHNSLSYMENFDLHVRRLRDVARLLGSYGVRLGLEYVGPRTLMVRDKYSFIGSMREAKELITAIGEPNVGLVLDSFHWFCARESVTDLLTLDPGEIVAVDLNDARSGRSATEQIDNERELPGSSGVIDLSSFLGSLVRMGYEGPVRAEPFNKTLNDLDNESAAKMTAEAMFKSVKSLD